MCLGRAPYERQAKPPSRTTTGLRAGSTSIDIEDVRLMRMNLLPEIQIKAAGGIRTYGEAVELLQAGASRLGTSSGVNIVQEASRS